MKMHELPDMYSLVNIDAIFIGWCVNISLNSSRVHERICLLTIQYVTVYVYLRSNMLICVANSLMSSFTSLLIAKFNIIWEDHV